jgi:hypothetical protein
MDVHRCLVHGEVLPALYANAYYAMVTDFVFVLFSPVRLDFALFAPALFTTFSLLTEHGLSFPIHGVSSYTFQFCASLKRPWLGHGPYTNGRPFRGREQDTSGLGQRLQIVAVDSADQR